MTYISTWKNKMRNNGGSITGAISKHSDKIYFLKFKDNQSYRNATVTRTNLLEENIDIRVVNEDGDSSRKRIYLLPRTKVGVGSYIKYEVDEESYIYLVNEFEYNLESPCCKVKKCEQVIKLSKDLEIPCVAGNEGFGVKLTSSNEFISESDTKIKVLVGDNPITKKIPLNTRFIIGKGEIAKNGIYVISDISIYEPNILVYTCKKDKYLANYDDLENGIAYNGELTLPEIGGGEVKPLEYVIEGESSIRKGQTKTYTINQADGSWQVEDYSNSVEIIDKNEKTIHLKCVFYGEYITLNYVDKNGDIVATKDIELVR